jgi:hypothetical protein
MAFLSVWVLQIILAQFFFSSSIDDALEKISWKTHGVLYLISWIYGALEKISLRLLAWSAFWMSSWLNDFSVLKMYQRQFHIDFQLL